MPLRDREPYEGDDVCEECAGYGALYSDNGDNPHPVMECGDCYGTGRAVIKEPLDLQKFDMETAVRLLGFQPVTK